MTHAGLGRDGLEMAVADRPTMIMLDLHLPDLNGIEVLAKLRGDPRTAAIPVVIASADASPDQLAGLQAAGADGYITKPIDVPQVLTLLDQFADRSPGADATARPDRGAAPAESDRRPGGC